MTLPVAAFDAVFLNTSGPTTIRAARRLADEVNVHSSSDGRCVLVPDFWKVNWEHGAQDAFLRQLKAGTKLGVDSEILRSQLIDPVVINLLSSSYDGSNEAQSDGSSEATEGNGSGSSAEGEDDEEVNDSLADEFAETQFDDQSTIW